MVLDHGDLDGRRGNPVLRGILMRPRSREQRRRQREYRHAVVNQPALPLGHDPVALMAVIDAMPRRVRDQINERGLDQHVYDRLPPLFQARIAMAMGEGTEDAISDVWDD